MLTITDVLALFAALDDGGDDALVLAALADALEEAGDPRADGLRSVGDRRPGRLHHHEGKGRWGWLAPGWDHPPEYAPAVLSREVYRRLPGRRGRSELTTGMAARTVIAQPHPTRHAAFLALAQALMPVA